MIGVAERHVPATNGTTDARRTRVLGRTPRDGSRGRAVPMSNCQMRLTGQENNSCCTRDRLTTLPTSPTSMSSNSSREPDGNPKKHGAILAHYVNMAQVLGEMFAPVLETVVHDLRKPDESIIAIYNGHLTGREVGGAATNLGRRLMKGDFPDVLVGYENESPNGQKLKSSSLAIRDEEGELIGVLGLNLNISYFDQFRSFIEQFISSERSEYVSTPERFQTAPNGMSTPKEDIQQAIHRYITSRNWNAQTLSYADKREIVEHLYKNGYFKSRGAVTIIAEELGLTRPSVYNYKNDYIERAETNQTTEQEASSTD